MFKSFFYVGAGSFIGGVARFIIAKILSNIKFLSFPSGTIAINLLGCFFCGIIMGCLERYDIMNNNLRLFMMVGVCGGFTTFSTFISDNFIMIRKGVFFQVILYTSISVFVGLFLFYIGYRTKWFIPK